MAKSSNGSKGTGGPSEVVRKQREIAEALRRKVEAAKKKQGGK